MTRCYICDVELDEPKIDHRDGKVRPCSDCEQVIDEAVQEFGEEDPLDEPDTDSIEDYLAT